MEPPLGTPAKRIAFSPQTSNSTLPHKFVLGTSPSPLPTNPKAVQSGTELLRPLSSHTVSVGWEDDQATTSQRSTSRLQIELAECVETKTITTTTTTKRTYPPLLVRQRSLNSLDAKEYPLAFKATPLELTKFSYELDCQTAGYPGAVHRTGAWTEATSLSSATQRSARTDSYNTQNDEVTNDHANIVLNAKSGYGRDENSRQKLSSMNPQRSSRAIPAASAKSPKPSVGKLRKSQRHIDQTAKDEPNTSRLERRRRQGLVMHGQDTFPSTPDMSEVDVYTNIHGGPIPKLCFDGHYTPQSGLSQTDSVEDAINQTFFSGAVATPPIAECDLEQFESADATFAPSLAQRPNVDIAVAQNASLPSPGLSPTFASAELNRDSFSSELGAEMNKIAGASISPHSNVSQNRANGVAGAHGMSYVTDLSAIWQTNGRSPSALSQSPSLLDAQNMIETFDSMSNDMKTFMVYQFLRRCPRKTLQIVADTVNPALKCNFLDQLPVELSLQILSFLDCKDLCQAAQVSKNWRNIIDTNETGWKELLDRDGFVLPAEELEGAIHQGWGWQNPHGPNGFEQDLSVQHAPSSEFDALLTPLTRPENETFRKVRLTTKRKRAPGGLGFERSKRRAAGHEFADKAQDLVAKYSVNARFHKSEGPLTAANAAALAVPDPQVGLPTLRKLHLFKSLYRRHFLMKRNWTSGKVEPHHFAFPAHPAHVITCLQFDDDKILTGSDDTFIHVYDTKTGVLRKKLEGHDGGVWALQYQGNVLVSGSTDRSVRVWDIEKGLCTQVFHGHTSTVRCLQILMPEMTGRTEKGHPIMAPDKPLIITGSRDSQLRVWRLPEQGSKRYIQTGPPANDADCPYFVRMLTGHTHSVRAIAAHQDTLVSGSYDNTVRVWKISTGETIHKLQGHTMKVYSVVLDHKRNRCISGSMDTFVKIWSLDTGSCLFTLEGHTSLVGLLDLCDERLVSAAADSTLRIWDPENGLCKSTLSAHTGAITCFQHDGQKVISGSDRTLKMWNVKTGECIRDLLSDLSGVWQVKFDERRCVAAVQRDNLTFVEVLDFGASRDGVPACDRGFRKLLRFGEGRGHVQDDEEQ